MKTVIVLFASLVASVSFANGVEKHVLPVDAQNVRLVQVGLEQIPTGASEQATASQQQEGVPANSKFATGLVAHFEFDSASAEVSGSGPDGQHYSWDSKSAELLVVLKVTSETLTAVQSGKLNAAQAFSFTVATETVQISTADTSSCEVNESGMTDSSCNASMDIESVTAPVISIQSL